MELSKHSRCTISINNLWSILDAGEKKFVSIIECWKSYSTADYTVNIKEPMNGLRSTVLSDCWKKLWPEAVTKLGIPQPTRSNKTYPHVNSVQFQDSHFKEVDIQDLKSHTVELPYFPAHKTHRDFFVRNFTKKKK
jgi:hypothetical protein